MSQTITTKIEDGVYSSILPNGLTVISHQTPIQSIAVGAWIKVGSRNENISEHGIAHFLEHMAFKGTKNRSAKQIVEQIENVGGDMNAATGIEITSYYFRLLKDDLNLGLDILADILLNPVFTEEEMAKEKDVIYQEIAAADDDPDDVLFDRFIEDAFAMQAIGRSILGTKKSVKALTIDHLRDFLKKHYIPQNMTIAMAGGCTHKQLLTQIEILFGDLKPNVTQRVEQSQFTPANLTLKKSLEQSYLLVGFESLHFNHPDFFAQQIMSQILGGGMSSRLFQNIRESKGLCYSIYSSSWGFSDAGLLFVYAATSSKNIEKVKTMIFDELIAILASISEQELLRACNQIKASQMMSLESPVSRSEQIARQSIFYKDMVTIEEILNKVTSVTIADLLRVSKNLFLVPEAIEKPLKDLKHTDISPHITVKLGG